MKKLREIDLEKELQRFEIPEVNENIINTRIKMIWEFYELDGTKELYWCICSVISLKGGNKVVVECNDKTEDTEEELALFRYNKSSVKTWRLCVKRKLVKIKIN